MAGNEEDPFLQRTQRNNRTAEKIQEKDAKIIALPDPLLERSKRYSRRVSRVNRALFVLLLDQSYSMQDPLGGSSERKMDELALAVNAQISNIVLLCCHAEGVRDYTDIGVIGYRTDEDDNAIIESPFVGDVLAGKQLVSITKIADNIGRIEKMTRQVYDDDTAETYEEEVDVPIWVDPVAEGGTPMCSALRAAYDMVSEWIDDGHEDSFPPIVIHFTDGENQEAGDPLDYAEPLKELETNDGNVLLFNCHLSETKAQPFFFPHSSEVLPNDYARSLFDMSSELPETLFEGANSEGFDLQPGARAMVFNADIVPLAKFSDVVKCLFRLAASLPPPRL